MLKIALLVLTLTPEGQLRLTLSGSENLTACETKNARIVPVLEDAGYQVVVALCGETDLQLTPYDPTVPKDNLSRYRVIIHPDNSFVVTPLMAEEACTNAPKATPAHHCAVSAQSVLSD